MNTFGIFTIAFNGYGRFAGQWLAFVSNMSPKPDHVTIVLGKDHGCQDIDLLKGIYPGVRIVTYNKAATFGKLRNIAIKHTTSEWTWLVSIDDKPMPDGIRTFKRALKEEDADYICSQWYTIGLDKPLIEHKSPTPLDSAKRLSEGKRMGFIIPHSPFKRWLWEKTPYKNSDLPNYAFLLGCVKNGAKFTKSDKPTTTYLRRSDSHARTTLKKIKKQANKEKRIMQRGIVEYYKDVSK